MEFIAIILLILSLYLLRTIIRFPNQQIEKRILTYIEHFPSKTKKYSFKLNSKKYKKALVLDDEIAEFADLLAISLVAGRGPIQALAEIEDSLEPKLRDLVRAALLRNASGMPLERSLLMLANDAKSEAMSQLVRSLQAAINRGTPLAENLRMFSHELRARRKEKILLNASKKEISMLVPIVFVVLPTVLVIAIYPALQVIRNLS